MAHNRWEQLPPVVRAWLPGLLVSALALWGFVEILDEVLENEAFQPYDQPLVEWLADHRTSAATTAMTVITNVFGPVLLPVLIAVGAAAWGWRTRTWLDPALLVGAMVLATVISMVVKLLIGRARPEESFQLTPGLEESFSFPSGHTTGAATLVLVTAYLAWRGRRSRRALLAWSLGSLAVVVLVGGSRLYLGYHFLSDVLAGVCVGLLVLGLVTGIDRWLALRPGAAPAPPPRDE